MIIITLLSILSAVLSIILYNRAGESCSLFILSILGIMHTDVGIIVAPSIILYFCMRYMLL
jgi:hypothetical protein